MGNTFTLLYFIVFSLVILSSCGKKKNEKQEHTPSETKIESSDYLDTLNNQLLQIDSSNTDIESALENSLDNSQQFNRLITAIENNKILIDEEVLTSAIVEAMDESKQLDKLIKTINKVDIKAEYNSDQRSRAVKFENALILIILLAGMVLLIRILQNWIKDNPLVKTIFSLSIGSVAIIGALTIFNFDFSDNSFIIYNAANKSKKPKYGLLVDSAFVRSNQTDSVRTVQIDSVARELCLKYVQLEEEPKGMAIVGKTDTIAKYIRSYPEELKNHLLVNYFSNKFREKEIIVTYKELKKKNIELNIEKMKCKESEILVFFLY